MKNENHITPVYELDFEEATERFLNTIKPLQVEWLKQVSTSVNSINLEDVERFLDSLCSQSRAAELLHTTQSRISKLISSGKINVYTQYRLVCIHEVKDRLENSKWNRSRKRSKASWIKLISNNPLQSP